MDDDLLTKTRRNEQDYTQALKIKAIELEPLSTTMPSYSDAKPIMEAVKKNLIHLPSDQDTVYGLLYMIMDTSVLAGGPPVRIQLTPNPGAKPIQAAGTQAGQMTHRNAVTVWSRDMDRYTMESEVTKTMINWLLKLIPEDLIGRHKIPLTGYATIPLQTIFQTFSQSFKVLPQDLQAQDKKIAQPWEPQAGIMSMFNTMTELLQEKAEMEGLATYTAAKWIECAYLQVYNTRQFVKPIARWNKLPAAQRATEQQFRTFFLEEYTVWMQQQKSMQEMGIANSVQVQNEVQELRREMDAKESRQKEENDALRRELQEKTAALAVAMAAMKEEHDQTASTTSTQMSTLTALSTPAQNSSDNKLDALIDLLSKQQQCAVIDTNKGKQNKGKKTEKKYKNNCNSCHTHGYDVADNHTSKTCKTPGPNHDREHTGDNPKPGASQKDKQFSKWANE